MRTRDMETLQLIDILIKQKRLTLRGAAKSFYSCYGIISDGKGGYDDSKSIIGRKSLDRNVERLCDAGIFVKDSEGYYNINSEYITLGSQADINTWKEFINDLAETGEFETYLNLAKYVYTTRDEEYMKQYMDESKIRLYQKSVRENLESLGEDKQVIKSINEALEKDWQLIIEYKGKKYTVLPVCYVISADGTRTYLHSVRKKELLALDLHYIKVVGHSENHYIDREKYMKQVQECWDVDVQSPKKVKILYDYAGAKEDYWEDRDKVKKVLQNHFGKPSENKNGQYVYEGEIRGVNDLKVWIRRYSEYCLVLEPIELRDEIIQGLKKKKERYEYE